MMRSPQHEQQPTTSTNSNEMERLKRIWEEGYKLYLVSVVFINTTISRHFELGIA